MNLGLVVFVIGLFGVPIALLVLGHRLRRRGPRAQAMFKGAVIGYCVAGTLAVVWGMLPPEAWQAGESGRGFAGLWSLLLFPILGALAFAVRAPRQ
jgi:hypothetical protein